MRWIPLVLLGLASCAGPPTAKTPIETRTPAQTRAAVAARGGFRIDADAPRPCERSMVAMNYFEPRRMRPEDVRQYIYDDGPTTCVLPVHLAATGLVACASRHADYPGGTAVYRYDDAGRLIAIDQGNVVDRFVWRDDTLAEVQLGSAPAMPVTIDGDRVSIGDPAHPWRSVHVVDGRPTEMTGDDAGTMTLQWSDRALLGVVNSATATTVAGGHLVLGTSMALEYDPQRCKQP